MGARLPESLDAASALETPPVLHFRGLGVFAERDHAAEGFAASGAT